VTDRPDTPTRTDAEVARRLRATMALRAGDMPPAGPMPLAVLDRAEPAPEGPGRLAAAGVPPVRVLPPLPAAGGEQASRGLASRRRRALAVAAAVLAAGGLAAAAVSAAGGRDEPADVAAAPDQATTTVSPPATVPPPTTGSTPTTEPNGSTQLIGVYGRGTPDELVFVSFDEGNGDVDVRAILGDGWEPIQAGPNQGYRTVEDLGNNMIWLTMGDGIVRVEGATVPVEELVPFAAAVTRGDDGRYTLTPPDGWAPDEGVGGGPATTTTTVVPGG
jgi:hypothetical protein